MKKIAVLLTCHNRRDKTIKCLNHLFVQSDNSVPFIMEVFLVDDGSIDGTATAVKDSFPTVNIIQGNGQLFWNRGMYLAWKEAVKFDPDYYLWLNDDTFIFPNVINQLLECAELTHNKATIVGNTCSATNKEKTTYGGISFDQGLLNPNGSLQKCDYFQGNCVLIPNYVYKKIGNLDPFFHHAIGDLDYGLRAKKNGLESYVAPNHIGTCENHETNPKWCLPYVPLKDRIKNLYSPLGNSHPYYFFKFEVRHYGIIIATKHFLSIHLRLLIPTLWK